MAFVGIATNLALYLKGYMGYTSASASQLLQVFKGTNFLTPLLGAYLADAWLGRYRVILIFSAVYMVGLLGITAVNTVPSFKPRFNAPPASGSYGPTVAAFWVFMYLIALGAGGIKPCVGSFGGDQFREGSPREMRYRSSFFNWFYFTINAGSLVAALVVTPVQEMKGYAVGFGIPAALFAVAIALLVMGAAMRLYHHVPPEGSPLRRIFQVLKCALVTNRRHPIPSDPSDLYEPPLGKGSTAFRMGYTPRMRVLDKAAIRHGVPGRHQPSLTEVEETKALLSLAPMVLTAVLFVIGLDPISTMLPFTGNVMQRGLGAIKIPAASMVFANQLGMVLSVVLYDLAVVPATRRMKRRITIMQRIGFGIVLQIIALLSAGLIETARYRVVAREGLAEKFAAARAVDPGKIPSDPEFTIPMSVWWQAIPNFIEGVSETFTNVAATELFFSQVSEGTRSLANSILLLAVAMGSYLAFALNKAVATGTGSDPWISQNPLAGHYNYYFFLNAGIVAVVAVLFFCWVSRQYQERPVMKNPTGMSTVELQLSAEAGEEVFHHHAPRPSGGGGGGDGALTPRSRAAALEREKSSAQMLGEDDGGLSDAPGGDGGGHRAASPFRSDKMV